ncbi:MAG: phosphoglucosamine mutase [Actinomycetes bacterium]
MALRFGTDGVRGPADQLTDEFIEALGLAAANVLGRGGFVVARDPRESGERIELALLRGLISGGARPIVMGVVPTPALAWSCANGELPGAMISASHNRVEDNGVKLFASGGLKLSDEVEARLETELDRIVALDRSPATGAVLSTTSNELSRYEDALVESIAPLRLDGCKVAIDCANGSASGVAQRVLGRLGADVVAIHTNPDGTNINSNCGSTHPHDLQRLVVESGAVVGLAFDGDADRVVAVDETGALVDGDHLLALCAIDMRDRGELTADAVVVTVMTNLGFHHAMSRQGIEVVETSVGDRYVLEALEQRGLALGGEQSGHVIFRRMATTGDGILTGIQLVELLLRRGLPLSVMVAESMTRLPQVLVNVVTDRSNQSILDFIKPDIADAMRELDGNGRVLVRPSGTEPMIRVMVEATDERQAQSVADRLAKRIDIANSEL